VALIEESFEDTLLITRHADDALLGVLEAGRIRLPILRTTRHHPADVRPTRAAIRTQLGLDSVILDCLSVHLGADDVVRRLLRVEALPPMTARADVRWTHRADFAAAITSEPSPPAAERPWAQPGWWPSCTAWISASMQAAGFGRPHRVEQIRAWEFSCVLRIEADQGTLYCKLLPPAYAAEPALVQQLAQWRPACVPPVVAVDPGARWLLLRACAGQSLEAGAPPEDWERAARAYAALQLTSSRHLPALRALGCRDRDLLTLRSMIGPLLDDDAALRLDAEHGLTEDELRRLRALRPHVEAACTALAASGLPVALEHGDLWASNVYVGPHDVAVIDWTDASLAHPFLSLSPLLQSARWDAQLAHMPDAEQRIMDAYLEPWTAFAPLAHLRRMVALARPLAAVHIATTYWRAIPQPHHQWWMPRCVPFFLRLALAEWDAAHA